MPIGSGGINSEIPRAISKTPISLGGFIKLPWFSSGRAGLSATGVPIGTDGPRGDGENTRFTTSSFTDDFLW
jgi:hypothetical protein